MPYAFEQCDHLLVVSKDERRNGKKLRVRNAAVSIAWESEEGREWLAELRRIVGARAATRPPACEFQPPP